MSFHEILARERKARGMSQEELAGRIQVSRQAVSKWENGDAMPDLTKLLALADALDISLDALCGREAAVPAESIPQKVQPTPAKRQSWRRPALCAVLTVCLVLCGGWAWWRWSQRNVVPVETAQAAGTLPDTLTVSGVNFIGDGDGRVSFRCVPSVVNEEYTYQITFADFDGPPQTFDVIPSGGVCAGTVGVTGGGAFDVALVISSGADSRTVLLATGLGFHNGGASWTPAAEKP